MQTLRPYQSEAIASVRSAWQAGARDTLIVMATGAGKTQTFLSLLMQELDANPQARALIVAHREELIAQPLERIAQMDPAWLMRSPDGRPRVGVVMAGVNDSDRQLTIATVQTLASKKRRASLLAHGPISHLVIDECHHAVASTYLWLYHELKAANPLLCNLGVTATPKRGDGDGLARVYAHTAAKVTIGDLVRQGYLVQPRWLGVAFGISIAGVHTRSGDYASGELATLLETPAGRHVIIEAFTKYAKERRTIAFTISVQGALDLAADLRARGINAIAVSGATPKDERRAIMAAFRRGEYQVLCNCQVATEGFDAPGTSCILMCRPTRSDALYTQCLDMETEVLTARGWQRHSTMTTDDQVAGFDPSTGAIRWVVTQSILQRPLAPGEQMYALQSPAVDLRVTGGHRMLMRHGRSPDPTWRFMEASDLAARRDGYQIPVAGEQPADGVALTPDELRLIGLWIADGTINQRTRQVSITQASHQPHNAGIVAILEGAGISYSTWDDENRKTKFKATSPLRRYTLHRGRDGDALAHLDPYLNKTVSPDMERLTAEQLAYVLEGLHLGDGNKQVGQTWTQRTYHIITGNRLFADRLQSLCVRRGFRCNVATRKTPTGEAYQIHIKREDRRHIGGANQADREHLAACESAPDEQVWCVTNELSTLIVRRNGKVAIVGNCIGRGLRPALGMAQPGEDCLILDFIPEDARDLVMAGDVLGMPRELRQALKEDRPAETLEAGEIQAGFTFDGERFDTGGTPIEIITRELDYLQTSAHIWHRRSGLMSLGLGESSDGVDRIVAISGDQLFMIWRRRAELMSWVAQLVKTDDPYAKASQIIDRCASQALTQKGRSWHSRPASDSQVGFLKKLARGDGLKGLDQLTQREAAELITHYQARQAIAAYQYRQQAQEVAA